MEFDVFFSKLELERHPLGKDVTINWRARGIHPEPGVFYTDANSFKIIKRDINAPRNYSRGGERTKSVAMYYYPINAGLFIEDKDSHEQMVVMNDRPQGGSAYKDGRLELMIHRLGTTTDQLGVNEGV